MAYHLKKTVVLVGMMGAGKSAVGRALSDALEVPFLDSDDEIVAAANMPIAEIFERDGEAFFRRRETQVILRLLQGPCGVLSTGGGAYMQAVNRDNIHQHGVAVWLDADLDVLWSRVGRRDTRPLLRTSNPRATLAEIFHARVPVYAKAELTVKSCGSYALEEMAQKVIETLLTRPDVLETT